MLPDFLPAAEVLAKGVKHVACYVADAITERRKAFDDDEAGDYLRCAGADALAEALCKVEEEQEVHEPPAWLTNVIRSAEEWGGAPPGPFQSADLELVTVCYFCDRPTDRMINTADDDREYVCERCADTATSPAAAIYPLAAAADPAAAEAFPPSMTAAGSPNPFTDCGLFSAGPAFPADLDETLSTVAELNWPNVAATLRVLANFLDPQ